MMKKQRIYVDTSVIGGKFDKEFSVHTEQFFAKVLVGEFTIVISDVLLAELENAPDQVTSFLQTIPETCIDLVIQNEASNNLAEQYIQAGVVGKTSLTDCQHIAIATIVNADILVSWNFKHIVNINRIRGYNSVNLANGYKNLEIRNPREIIDP